MTKIDFLESLLNDLDDFNTLDEAKEHLSILLDEAYQEEELRQSYADDLDPENEDF